MRLLILASIAASLFAQPTVSNVRALPGPLSPNGDATHSTQLFRYTLSVNACWQKIVVTNTTTSQASSLINNRCGQTDIGFAVSGLAAGTTYNYAISASTDGTNYSVSPATGSFTLPGLPPIHPTPPEISGLWTPAFPNTAGYQTFTMNSSCVQTSPHAGHTISQTASDAVTLQPAQGSIVNIPPGAPCGSITFPNDTQILTVPMDSSHVNTSTGVFTATNAPWTIATGNTVRLNGASCLPGSYTQGNDNNSFQANGCIFNGPFTFGTTYYMVGVSGSTFQLSATLGGSAIVPGDTGQVSGTMGLQQWPLQNSNWIIFETTTPDYQFCPQGVRCMGSIWQPKMATITATCGQLNTGQTTGGLMNHNIWFRGIEWTDTSCTASAANTIDPEPSGYIIDFPWTWVSNYIVFDRNYLHGQPLPNRYVIFAILGGANIAMIDSDFENVEYWRPSASPAMWNGSTLVSGGLSGTLSGSTITIVPGSIQAPINTCTAGSNLTFAITGGSVTLAAWNSFSKVGPIIYATSGCVPTMLLPTGMTGTCTGSMTDSGSTSHGCVVSTTTTPNWPSYGGTDINAFTLGTFALTSGTPSGYQSLSNFTYSAWYTEGAQAILQSAGPGPTSYLNNYFESTGLVLHFGDDTAVDSVGNWFRQNWVNYLQQYKAGSPTWNGYEYAQRNGPEWKHGQQIKADGNIFSGCWAGQSLSSPCLLAHVADSNPGVQTYYYIADVDVTNNTFWNVVTAIDLGGTEGLGLPSNPAAARLRIQNNIVNTNGFTQTDGNAGCAGLSGCSSYAMGLDPSIEDLIVDHNTFYDIRGTQPVLWHQVTVEWQEGCQVTNNFWWFGTQNSGVTSEPGSVTANPTISGTGSSLFNAMCTSDPHVPSSIIAGNVAVPYYTSGLTPVNNSIVSAQSICTNFGGGTLSGTHCPSGLIGTILAGSTASANLASIGFTSTASGMVNLKLLYSSQFVSGATTKYSTDGTDVGVNMNALLTAQGAVNPPTVLSITATTATISWFAYDGSIACAVDYATAPNDPSTQTGGGRLTASAANSQSVNLTGLSALTTYNYRVLCPVNQPTGAFSTP